MSIFKACDIRGVYGEELTDDVFYRIGRALGTKARGKCVLLGGDVRTSTPALKSVLARGILESGADILDIGIVSTPAFYFARRHLGIDAGAMVTASHNPPEFNGLKLILGPLPITVEELESVRRLAESEAFSSGSGNAQTVDIIPSYRTFIQSVAPRAANAGSFRVVLDCGNGCSSESAPAVFRNMGYHIEELFCIPDGTFPNRSPNSAVPANLAELSRRVRDTGANLGVAFDGDGDRVAFVDDRGRFLSSDKTIVMLARHSLAKHPGGTVIYDLKCSSVVPEAVKGASGTAIAERSGHTFIKTRMIVEDAVFGGELSGHYFYKELYGGDDGLYSALLMASIVSGSGRRLSEMADSLLEYTTTPDIRVSVSGDREAAISRVVEYFPPSQVSTLDGVKVQFPGGWGLARVSVTEPVITLRFEAESDDRLAQIIQSFTEPIPEVREYIYAALELRERGQAV